jgi:type II secretory pathway pseudopilin PulG
MRLPRVRFTIRRIMIVVAIVALLMGGMRLLWLRSVYRKAALAHATFENLARTLQRMVENEGKDERELEIAFGMKVESESEVVKAKRAADARVNQKTAEYHAAQRQKYERAASRPWVPIAPDSPPPEPDVAPNPPEPE